MDYRVPKNIALTVLVYIVGSMIMSSYDVRDWNFLVDFVAVCFVWDIWTGDDE